MALEDVKKERERFVAFAFAAAEIFLEVDEDGFITFEGGAVDRLYQGDKPSLDGQNIYDIVTDDDREILRAFLHHLSHKGRIGPVPIRFLSSEKRDLPIRIFALRIPTPNTRTYISLRTAPISSDDGFVTASEEEAGLICKDNFIELTQKTMKASRENNQMFLTVASVDGLQKATERFGEKHAHILLKRIAAHMKTLSIDGESASQIDDKNFAFLHKTKGDSATLSAALTEVGGDIQLKTTYSTIAAKAGDMPEDQVLRTLNYVLNKFCKDPNACDFETLTNAYDTLASEAQTQVAEIRTTISSGNFKLAFQPVRLLADRSIHHHEVLSRFTDSLGEQTTAEVIEFAENVGVIEEFDLATCFKALDYIKKMRNLGTPTPLSVNISGRTIENQRVIPKLLETLTANKAYARSLILELTETSAISDYSHSGKILSEIKALGYSLSLDDFGSGASGYQYLRAFNVDFVKIDGQYIADMAKKNYQPTFLLSMVRLCNDLGLKTIGEHVETKFQADLLRSLGVDYGQGYLFGKPDFSPVIEY